jgi:hypothetical protein
MAEKNFDAFKQTIEERFMGHPVVTDNAYTRWFARGEMPVDHLRRFAIDFSVFSNQFLLAALNRVINADAAGGARVQRDPHERARRDLQQQERGRSPRNKQ